MNRREALQRVAYLMGGALAAPTVAGVLGGCRASTEVNWAPATLSGEQVDLVTSIAEHILPDTNTPGATAAGVNRYIDRMLSEWYPQELRQRFLDGLADVDRRAQELRGQTFLNMASDQQRNLIATIDRETFPAPAEQERDDVREETEGTGEDPLDEPVDEPADDPYGVSDSVRVQRPERRLSQSLDEALATQIRDARERAAERASAPRTYVRADTANEGLLIGDPSFFSMMKELTLVGFYTSEVGATEELAYVQVPGRWEGCIPYEDVGKSWAV